MWRYDISRVDQSVEKPVVTLPFCNSVGRALASAIAGDAVVDATEFDELFDVDVDQVAGMIALVPPIGSAGSRALILAC
jgi:hypothetical protein